jgi:hypothetical protein
MKIRIALALTMVLAAGCDTPSAIDDYTEDVPLEFSVGSVQAGPPITEPEIAFRGGDGEIVVEGRLRAPDPCQEITADAVNEGGRLRLVVRVRSKGGVCADVVGQFAYTARLLELAPGTYDLSVAHEYRGSGWSLYRQDTQVTVR